MYRFQPTYVSSLPTDLGYSRPHYPHQRYVSPLAEQLRAAEAQREEEELLRRLEEIRLQKQQDELLRRRCSPCYSSYLADDDFERSTALRRRQQELELEYLRRKQEEEARLLALKRSEEELKLQQLARLREEEEARLAALRREAEQAEAARQCRSKNVSSCYPHPHDNSEDLLSQFFRPHPQNIVRRPSPNNDSETQSMEQLFSNFVKHLNNKQPERKPTPKPVQEEPKRRTPSPVAREAGPSPQTLEEVLRLMFNPQPQVSSSTTEKKITSPSRPVVQDKPNKPAKTESDSESLPVSPSLKEQLEARLNNDQSNEIKDTIQAILASLSSPSAPPAPAPASLMSATSSSEKGKGKAPEPQHNAQPSSSNARKALEAVRNIEASLTALQDEFEFPSEVDFSPAPSRDSSPIRDDVSHTSESDTPTLRKLAYTARNHPIRSYEQTLSRLLAQLDEIESHGNADVRISRKAVVARVEGALEELEQKVEARWNKWNKSHRLEREDEFVEQVQKKVEDVEKQPQEESIPPAPETTNEPASVSPPSPIDDNTEAPQHPSYAEVVKHSPQPESPAVPSSSNPEFEASPATGVADDLESSIEPSYDVEEQTEEVVSGPETTTTGVEPLPQTDDNLTGTDVADAEANLTSAEPEVIIASSYPPASNTSEVPLPSSYPPISSDSSVATIRPSILAGNLEGLSVSGEEHQVSEDEQSVLDEESEDEVVDTTFLLRNDANTTSDLVHKQPERERDSEDVGSDWSEVEA